MVKSSYESKSIKESNIKKRINWAKPVVRKRVESIQRGKNFNSAKKIFLGPIYKGFRDYLESTNIDVIIDFN